MGPRKHLASNTGEAAAAAAAAETAAATAAAAARTKQKHELASRQPLVSQNGGCASEARVQISASATTAKLCSNLYI